MSDIIEKFVSALKAHLKDNDAIETCYEDYDTETGGSSYYAIDFDKLCAEIDAFSKTFQR